MDKIFKRALFKIGIICMIPIMFILLIIIFFKITYEIKKPPSIENGEFPFRFVYEMNGETFIVEDIVIAEFVGIDTSTFGGARGWSTKLKYNNWSVTKLLSEKNVNSIFEPDRINDVIVVELHYGTAGYYLGDPVHSNARPRIAYTERYREGRTEHNISTVLNEEELEKYFGITILEFEFSEPIENEFK